MNFISGLKAKGVSVGKKDLSGWYKNFEMNFGYKGNISVEALARQKAKSWHIHQSMSKTWADIAKQQGKKYTPTNYYG